jgi:hypothetical protein
MPHRGCALFVAIDTRPRYDDECADYALDSKQLPRMPPAIGDDIDQDIGTGSKRPGERARLLPINADDIRNPGRAAEAAPPC